jgi:hypothetical protein
MPKPLGNAGGGKVDILSLPAVARRGVVLRVAGREKPPSM